VTRSNAWLVAAILPFALMGAWHGRQGFELVAGDSAQYMLHARALAEGRAYADIGFLYTDFNAYIGPRAEPPGLSLTVLPLYLLFGARPLAFLLLMLGSGVLFLLWAAKDLSLSAQPALALAGVAMAGVALEASDATDSLMADLPFCAAIWGAAWLADRPGPWRAPRSAGLAVCGAAAILYRVAAAPLVPALVLFAVVHRREHGWRPLVPAAIWGLTLLGMMSALPIGGAVNSQFSSHAGIMLGHVARNVATYKISVGEGLLQPFPSGGANTIYHGVASVLVALGGWDWLRRGGARSFPALFGLSYLGMLAITPTRATRYLWPLYPILALALLNGLALALARVPRLRDDARRPALAIAGLLALLAAAVHLAQPHPRAPEERPEARAVYASLQELDAVAPARVVYFKPRTLTWHTRIPAMGTFVAPPAEWLEELRRQRITHVVVGDLGAFPEKDRALRAVVEGHPELFREEYRNPGFAVYRFDAAPRAAAGLAAGAFSLTDPAWSKHNRCLLGVSATPPGAGEV